MDTTFPGNGLLHRRVISPGLCQAAYALIILGEGLTGLTLLMAAVVLLWHVRSDAARFNRTKPRSISARRSGFWCGSSGFLVVGGEWFQMWQSQTWNGQQAAFRFYVTILAALIFVNQQDADLPEG